MHKLFNKILCMGCVAFLLGIHIHAIAKNTDTQTNLKTLQQTRHIVVMGDSLSAAYQLKEQEGWVAMLAQRLKEKGYPYKVINGSVSGATTQAGLQRLPALLKTYQPEIVLLELGGNDGLQGKPIPLITKNLRTMIEMSQKQGAQVVLLGIQIPPNYGERYTKPFFEQFATLANSFELPYLPFLLEGVALNPELMFDDGIHPNAKGQPIILENVWPVVQPLLRK